MIKYYRIMAGLLMIAPIQAGAADKETTPAQIEINDAQYQCEQFILKTLDDPYKAKFDFFEQFPATKNTNGSFAVTAGYSETETSPKKKSECSLTKSASGDWQLIAIKALQ